MKRTISHLLHALPVILVSSPLMACAQSPNAEPVKSVLTNFLAFLNKVTPTLIALAFVVFGWGVIKLITAGEDPKKTTDAKGILTWGIIAIFILASMFGIILFIKMYIGIPGNRPVQIPKFQ